MSRPPNLTWSGRERTLPAIRTQGIAAIGPTRLRVHQRGSDALRRTVATRILMDVGLDGDRGLAMIGTGCIVLNNEA
jgi:hypothetical protein